MKRCTKCFKLKTLDGFSFKNKQKNKYNSFCKECRNKYSREVWYPKNKEKHKEASRVWKKNNKFKKLSKKYNLCEQKIMNAYLNPNNICPICKKTSSLILDHCHEEDRFRGFICNTCNTMIGRLGDTEQEILTSINNIVEYLKIEHREAAASLRAS